MNISDWQVYIILAIALISLEAFLPTFFFFPLGFAALGTALAAPFVGFDIELLVFACLSLVFFIISVKYLRPQFKTKRFLTGADALVGVTAQAQEDIDEQNQKGFVKVYADQWTAMPSQSGQFIPKGSMVRIERVSGNKVYVSRVED